MPENSRQPAFLIAFMLMLLPVCFAGERMQSGAVIFVSFSMPRESLKGWMNEAAKIRAPVVIRGLVNHSFRQTLQKIQELASDNRGGLQIDPMLFRKYHIRQVPAVVVRNGEAHDRVYGDVHLEQALRAVARKRDALSPVAENAMKMLRVQTA